MNFEIELLSGETISTEMVEKISNEIVDKLKTYELTLPVAEHILQETIKKIKNIAIVK